MTGDNPVTDLANCCDIVAFMCFDITSGKVRYSLLISKWLLLQHQNPFLIKRVAAETLASEIQAEFKWHVHPVELVGFGRLTPA